MGSLRTPPVRPSRAASVPTYRAQQPTRASLPPEGDDWLHEFKLAGHRVGCLVLDDGAKLLDGEGRPFVPEMAPLLEALRALPVKSALLDGVVTKLLLDGRTAKPTLPNRATTRANITLVLFDLLYLDGRDLRRLPLEQRKAQLHALLADADQTRMRYAEHIAGGGRAVFDQACNLKVAGIISKARRARHQSKDTWYETVCPKEAKAQGAARDVAAHALSAVTITTPARPVYPRLKLTKIDLARYYAAAASRMLPWVARRPLTLVRCEKGVSQDEGLRTECKFLRHEPGWHRWAKPPIQRVRISEQRKVGEYLYIDSAEGLLSLIQGDILEIHSWNSTVDDVEKPDRFVFDIDPGAQVPWDDVVDAALRLRALLAQRELTAWVKHTGGKGVHVVVPFLPEHAWPAAYAAAHRLCHALVQERPQLFTLNFSKPGRERKILLDYKRNHRAAVAVAAYSARANPRGTVSMPISWKELQSAARPSVFDLEAAAGRLAAPDPWAQLCNCRQRLLLPE